MATSKVDICNQALSLISQQAINSIDAPKDKLEIICAKWYEQVRRAVLAAQPWNFAKARALAPETTAPLFGYERAFQLPADYIRIIQIGNTRQDYVTYYKDFSVEDGLLLINYDQEGNLPIVYTKDEKTVVKFSSWFTDAFAIALAIKISPEVNRTQNEIQQLEVQYQQSLNSAKQLEGQESPVITVMNSRFKAGITDSQKYGNPD